MTCARDSTLEPRTSDRTESPSPSQPGQTPSSLAFPDHREARTEPHVVLGEVAIADQAAADGR